MAEYCTIFSTGDYDGDEWVPCRCPKCKGYLPQDFPDEEGIQFQCRRCGTILEIILDPPEPEEVEWWNEQHSGIIYELGLEPIPEYEPEYNSGRICVVPDYAVRIEKVDYKALRKTLPSRKHATDGWAYGLGFSRRVWRDKVGEFIMINGERLGIGDSRISIVETGKKGSR